MDDLFDMFMPELPEAEEPKLDKLETEFDETVDYAVFKDGYLYGYRNGGEAPVITAGSYTDIETATAAMPLFDKDGNIVYPENAPPNLEQQNRADIDYIAIMTGVKLNV